MKSTATTEAGTQAFGSLPDGPGPTLVEPIAGQERNSMSGGVEMSSATARVARSLLEGGTVTASELAKRLYLTPTAVRRHLDSLLSRGFVTSSMDAPFGPYRERGRGRPARYYTLTPLGRDAFETAYGDVAIDALSFLVDRVGREAVLDFARERAASIEARYATAVADATSPKSRAVALAEALRGDGFAATAEDSPLGIQLCQHHCPVTHVAETFPEFCEAEREVFSRLLGVHVTRLSTIAGGGGICTTLVPIPTDPPATDAVETDQIQPLAPAVGADNPRGLSS